MSWRSWRRWSATCAWSAPRCRPRCSAPGPINTNIIHSERNRAAESAAEHIDTRQGEKFWRMLTDQLAHGMDPDEVGTMVLDAVQEDRFWVLTHPQMAGFVERQVAAMVADRSLLRA